MHRYSFSLRSSQQSKSELIQNFDTLVDRLRCPMGAQLLKVVADPKILARKSIYVLGKFTEL